MPDLSEQFRLDLPEEYDAYKTFSRPQRSLLLVPSAPEPHLCLRYATLLYSLASASGTRMEMVFGAAIVHLAGRNLDAVLHAVATERCAWVRQFDPKHWPREPDTGEACITSLTFRLSVSPETLPQHPPQGE